MFEDRFDYSIHLKPPHLPDRPLQSREPAIGMHNHGLRRSTAPVFVNRFGEHNGGGPDRSKSVVLEDPNSREALIGQRLRLRQLQLSEQNLEGLL